MTATDGSEVQDGIWVGRVDVSSTPLVLPDVGVTLTSRDGQLYVPTPSSPDEQATLALAGDVKLVVTLAVESIQDGDVVTGVVSRSDGAMRVARTLARGEGAVILTDARAIGTIVRSAVDAPSVAARVDEQGHGQVLVFTVARRLLEKVEHRFGGARFTGDCEMIVARAVPLGDDESVDVEAALESFVRGAVLPEPDTEGTEATPTGRASNGGTRACSACGRPAATTASFCRACGARLAEPSADAPATRDEASPETHEPPAGTPSLEPDDASTCTTCSAHLTPGQKFCRQCGTAVAAEEPDRAAPGSLWATAPGGTLDVAACEIAQDRRDTVDESPAAGAPSCPHCASEISPGQKFCRSCGCRIETPATLPALGETAVMASVRGNRPATSPPVQDSTPGKPRPPGSGRRTALLVIAVCVVLAAGVGAGVLLVGSEPDDSSASDTGQPASTTIQPPETTPKQTATQPATQPDANGASGRSVLPAGSKGDWEGPIEDMLLAWHRNIVDGNFRAAWNQLTDRKRRQQARENGYSTWRRGQKTLADHLDPDGLRVRVLESNSVTGVVTVRVTGMGYDGSSRCSRWEGITWVRYERGAWKYDPGYSTTPERRRAYKDRYAELLGGSC